MTIADAPQTAIGTLNEGPLHEALKLRYTESGGRNEVAVGRFVADVINGVETPRIIEVQTGGLGSLRKKLDSWLDDYPVTVVHPIPGVKHILKVDEHGEIVRRRSPKRGAITDVLSQLVYVPTYLLHPNFRLEVVLTEEEELRIPDRKKTRKGWRVAERRLVAVLERTLFAGVDDLFDLLGDDPLPDEFTTAELATALDRPRWAGQKLAYCLRSCGAIEICGKTGNSVRYRDVRDR